MPRSPVLRDGAISGWDRTSTIHTSRRVFSSSNVQRPAMDTTVLDVHVSLALTTVVSLWSLQCRVCATLVVMNGVMAVRTRSDVYMGYHYVEQSTYVAEIVDQVVLRMM